MKRGVLLACSLVYTLQIFAQESRIISGKVTDNSSKEALIGASVTVKGSTTGALTDVEGNYTLQVPADAKTIVFSYIGYQQKEVAVGAANAYNVSLESTDIMTQDVTVTSTRTPESIKQASMQVEKMGVREIKNAASGNFYQSIGNYKGVDVQTSSFGFQTLNLRGFGGTSAFRSLQMIDGVDNASPGLQFPIGNLVGINDLDLQSVEIVSGPASGLYGPNALQGVITMQSKNPYDFQGLSAMVKVGATTRPAPYYEGQFRYAQSFGKDDKWAFKITGSYFQTKDWVADDDSLNNYGNIETTQNISSILRARQFDQSISQQDRNDAVAINNWLDFNPIANPNKLTMTSPGYKEKYLTDYNSYSFKLGAELDYKITKDIMIGYTGKFGMGSAIYQGVNRYQIKDILFHQHKVELKGKNFFVKGYGVIEDAGNSYDVIFTGNNISKAGFADYISAFTSSYFDSLRIYTNDFNASTEAKQWMVDSARNAAIRHADAEGWIATGSHKFDSLSKAIKKDGKMSGLGSRFIDHSMLWHAEGQYNFKLLERKLVNWDLIVGASYRIYMPNSSGTIFEDTLVNRYDTLANGDPNPKGRYVQIRNQEFAFFAQTQLKITDHLRLLGTLRMDKNQNFQARVSPRGAAVITFGTHTIRVGAGTAFRNPTLQNQYILLNLGPITLAGNLRGNDNVYTLQSVQDFHNYYDTAFAPNAETAVKYLQSTKVEALRQERVTTIDLGYRTDLLKNRLTIDFSAYYSWYKDFLGFTRVVQPNIGTAGQESGDNQILGQNYTVLQYQANSKGTVPSWGASIDVRYYVGHGIRPYINYTYTDLDSKNLTTSGTLILSGFNTPKHKVNIGIEGHKVWKNLGFTLNWKWVDSYEYQSPFADGVVPSFHTMDMQVSYEFTKIYSTLRVGASNLYNNWHIEAVGAPKVGALYYTSLTFDMPDIAKKKAKK